MNEWTFQFDFEKQRIARLPGQRTVANDEATLLPANISLFAHLVQFSFKSWTHKRQIQGSYPFPVPSFDLKAVKMEQNAGRWELNPQLLNWVEPDQRQSVFVASAVRTSGFAFPARNWNPSKKGKEPFKRQISPISLCWTFAFESGVQKTTGEMNFPELHYQSKVSNEVFISRLSFKDNTLEIS